MKTKILTVFAILAFVSPSFVIAGDKTELPVKAFLGGAYNSETGLMEDTIRESGLLPLKEPYTEMGYIFTTGEQVIADENIFHVTGENAIIDWVVLEVRARRTGTPVVYSQAGFIQADGDVVSVDGVSKISVPFSGSNFYISLRHRNHLGVMTARPIDLARGADFTSQKVYGTEAVNTVDGVQTLWAGNANFNGNISYLGSKNDREAIQDVVGIETPNNVVFGYSSSDTNMDGYVKYTGSNNDRALVLRTLGGDPVKVRFEQLPKVK